MRFLTVITMIAGLAATTTAFDKIIANPVSPNFPPKAIANAHSCSSQYCQRKTSVRFCNDDNKVKYMRLQEIRNAVEVLASTCQADYKGKRVAGGVIDHPDRWNVIVQADDAC
ncbi:uncharacterized protein BDV14DRAFT_204614 [Aspergillus stella-maris]|uniref:uncharacterized protein n=1 Tax=Aspergillus stella-maris TaxID=1810926 RepID=UPI003CCE3D44